MKCAFLIAFLGGSFLLSACGTEENPRTVAASGTVVNTMDGVVVSGASVTLEGGELKTGFDLFGGGTFQYFDSYASKTATTSAAGRFDLSVTAIGIETCRLTVTADSFITSSEPIDCDGDGMVVRLRPQP